MFASSYAAILRPWFFVYARKSGGSEGQMRARRVLRVIRGRETSAGAGVRLRRSIGGPEIDHLDPFLLLDEFKSDDQDGTLA